MLEKFFPRTEDDESRPKDLWPNVLGLLSEFFFIHLHHSIDRRHLRTDLDLDLSTSSTIPRPPPRPRRPMSAPPTPQGGASGAAGGTPLAPSGGGGGGGGGPNGARDARQLQQLQQLQFVVHPLPGAQEQLFEKLRAVAERLNRLQAATNSCRSERTAAATAAAAAAAAAASSLAPPGSSPAAAAAPGPSSSSHHSSSSSSLTSGSSSAFLSDLTSGLRQIEVGPSHFAFLLNDGRICRLPFSVISDRLDLNRSGAAGGEEKQSCLSLSPLSPTGLFVPFKT